jgi:hypothetical protein
MFKKLFGKKNDGFFMQVDESKPAAVKVEPAAKAEKAEEKESIAPAPTAVEEVAQTADLAAESTAKVEPTAKATKTSIKEKKKADKKEAKTAKKGGEKVETPLVAAPVAVVPVSTVTNFATEYLIKPSSNGSRRRPGANMKSFVNMAREVKK